MDSCSTACYKILIGHLFMSSTSHSTGVIMHDELTVRVGESEGVM